MRTSVLNCSDFIKFFLYTLYDCSALYWIFLERLRWNQYSFAQSLDVNYQIDFGDSPNTTDFGSAPNLEALLNVERRITTIIGIKYSNIQSTPLVNIYIIMGIVMCYLWRVYVNYLNHLYGVSITESWKCIDKFFYYLLECE